MMDAGKVTTSLLVAALLAGVAGCASGGGSPASTSAAGTAPPSAPIESSSAVPSTAQATPDAAATVITIKDFAFGDPITVSPGATVTVKNEDSAPHTVTADQNQLFDAKVKGNGDTVTFTVPSQPGTYAFHCALHPNMHGTLTVK